MKLKAVTHQYGSIPNPSTFHSCATVGNKIYIFSAVKEYIGPLNVHVYNMDTCCWSQPKLSGKIPSGRYLCATQAVGVNIFIFGGCMRKINETHYYNGLFKFDTTSNDFEFIKGTGPVPLPRAGASMVFYDDSLVIYGGCQGNQLFFCDVIFFDLENQTWIPKETHGCDPPLRAYHSANLIDDVMYVFGGMTLENKNIFFCNSLYMLDLEVFSWKRKFTPIETTPSPRCCHASLVIDNNIYIAFGGELTPIMEPKPFSMKNSVHVYNTKDECWKKLDIKVPRKNMRFIKFSMEYNTLMHEIIFYCGDGYEFLYSYPMKQNDIKQNMRRENSKFTSWFKMKKGVNILDERESAEEIKETEEDPPYAEENKSKNPFGIFKKILKRKNSDTNQHFKKSTSMNF